MRRKWQDPAYRAKQADAKRRGRDHMADAIKRKWRDPAYRAKQALAKRPYQQACAKRQAQAQAEREQAQREQEQARRELIKQHRQAWRKAGIGELDGRAYIQARNAFIRQARADSLTFQTIGEICGLSRQRAWQVVNQPKAQAKQAKAQAKRELIEKHKAIWQASPAYGQPGPDARAVRNALIAEAKAAGLTLQNCADIYGLTLNRVWQILTFSC